MEINAKYVGKDKLFPAISLVDMETITEKDHKGKYEYVRV